MSIHEIAISELIHERNALRAQNAALWDVVVEADEVRVNGLSSDTEWERFDVTRAKLGERKP